MKRWIIRILLLLTTLGASRAEAQLDREYFFWVGRNYLAESKYRDAIEILNVLLRTDPGAHEAYFLRGVAKYNLDDLYGAAADFTTAIEKNPVYTLAYHYRAITRSRLGDYDDALGDFREAIDLRPDLPGPYYSRGVTYLLSQQFERAIADFDEFLKHEPRVSDAYINKGASYLYLRDTLSAYASFDRAIENNRYDAEGYNRRGGLYMSQERWDEALADFDTAISLDSLAPHPWFNRALVYANTYRPVEALAEIDRVIALDSTLSVAWFNRALIRSQIGDYNNALADYDRVASLNPGNVLVYYNRASLNAQLGFYREAIADYTEAIDLYPDFANAYLRRSELRYLLMDVGGSEEDKRVAEAKIAEYRSKLTDSTFSIYADTSRQFNRLISFERQVGAVDFSDRSAIDRGEVTLLPLFRFTLWADTARAETIRPARPYDNERVIEFLRTSGLPGLRLTTAETNVPTDSLFALDAASEAGLRARPHDWTAAFARGVTRALIRQYTHSIESYTRAIELDPSNPFLYINRSTTQAEMTDFISSMDFGKITFDSDPVNRLQSTGTRTYNYDEAIHDLTAAAKLLPDMAHIYYNRAGLYCLSGNMPEAFDDYTRAIELYPDLAEAYYNRGLVQIYLKDTQKGCLDLSKAGELGIEAAYEVLRRYGSPGR